MQAPSGDTPTDNGRVNRSKRLELAIASGVSLLVATVGLWAVNRAVTDVASGPWIARRVALILVLTIIVLPSLAGAIYLSVKSRR